MNPVVDRHQDRIADGLSRLDRVDMTGILPDIGYTGTMACYPGAPGSGRAIAFDAQSACCRCHGDSKIMMKRQLSGNTRAHHPLPIRNQSQAAEIDRETRVTGMPVRACCQNVIVSL